MSNKWYTKEEEVLDCFDQMLSEYREACTNVIYASTFAGRTEALDERQKCRNDLIYFVQNLIKVKD